MCTEGTEDPKDDKSYHEQLEVIPSYLYPSILKSTKYIFAGELVRVKLRDDYVFWGKLHFDHILRLHHLYGFLTGLSSDVNQIPDEIGLDVRDLRRVHTPTASMGKGYFLLLKDHMASQTQSVVPQAPVTTHVAIPSFGFSGLPRHQHSLQPRLSRQRLKITTRVLTLVSRATIIHCTLALHHQPPKNTASPSLTARAGVRARVVTHRRTLGFRFAATHFGSSNAIITVCVPLKKLPKLDPGGPRRG
jgi:hypothetical protein